LSGSQEAVEKVSKLSGQRRIACHKLNVANAFHSPFVSAGAKEFDRRAQVKPSRSLTCQYISSVDGLDFNSENIKSYLVEQIVRPVNFVKMAQDLAKSVDFLIEVGPASVLSGLTNDILLDQPPKCLSVEGKTGRHSDFLKIIGRCFAMGAAVRFDRLFE